MIRFGERLKELRTSEGMTRKYLAERLNVSVRLVGYWEHGERECDFQMLIKIADLFATSVDYLLGRIDY